jgi:hypothetical protein
VLSKNDIRKLQKSALVHRYSEHFQAAGSTGGRATPVTKEIDKRGGLAVQGLLRLKLTEAVVYIPELIHMGWGNGNMHLNITKQPLGDVRAPIF